MTYTPRLMFQNGTSEADIAKDDWANLRRTEKLVPTISTLKYKSNRNIKKSINGISILIEYIHLDQFV